VMSPFQKFLPDISLILHTIVFVENQILWPLLLLQRRYWKTIFQWL